MAFTLTSPQQIRQRWPLSVTFRAPSSRRVRMANNVVLAAATETDTGTAGAAKPSREARKIRDNSSTKPGVDIGRGMGGEFDTVVTNAVNSTSFKVAKVPTKEDLDWRPAPVIRVEDVAQGVRCITVEAECSREFVPRENAYTSSGQLAQIRLVGQENSIKIPVSSPPFSLEANHSVTMKSRCDMPSGFQKQPQYFISVKCPLQLHVVEKDAPEIFNLKEGDELEVGPFDSTGMDLRPVLLITRLPTLLLFAYGKGIAVAKALIETRDADAGSLTIKLRRDVRLFYFASKPSLLAYKECFEEWQSKRKVKVCTAVESADEQWDGQVGSFQELWDEDDLEYDPVSTAVVVCAEKEVEQELDELLANADIVKEQTVKWII